MDSDDILGGIGVFFFVCLILSQIPVWVYVTFGCLLAVAFVGWLLVESGIVDAIDAWWAEKPVEKRIRIRKTAWLTILESSVVLLCAAFPIEAGIPVALLVTLAFGARWSRQRRARGRATAVCDIDERAVA